MKTGLFFGSFNPIHIGHLAIANYMVEFTDLNDLWFIISPHNPFKNKSNLLIDQFRLDMVELAIGDDFRFKASDIEFHMPKPSYTIDTLAYLKEKFPQREFVLIMGSDGLSSFHKWKNYEQIIAGYSRYVYPRNPDDPNKYADEKNLLFVDAPRIEISSSFIRKAIKSGKNIRYFLHPLVYDFIQRKGFYIG